MNSINNQEDKTGFDFALTFIDGCGISPYSVLEAAWVLPAIIVGIRKKIWEKPDNDFIIRNLWIDLNLMWADMDNDKFMTLTKAGKNIVAMADLFEYEFSMMQQQLDDNHKTNPEKYVKLRKALSMYSDRYLPTITNWLDLHSGKQVLDFAGGDGYYLQEVLKADTDRHGVLYDKAPNFDLLQEFESRCGVYRADFREDSSSFFTANEKRFDTIIMSEILHCMKVEEYNTVMEEVLWTLADGGKLIIIEQRPNFRLDWRLDAMTEGGESLNIETVIERLQNLSNIKLEPLQFTTTATHYAVNFGVKA